MNYIKTVDLSEEQMFSHHQKWGMTGIPRGGLLVQEVF